MWKSICWVLATAGWAVAGPPSWTEAPGPERRGRPVVVKSSGRHVFPREVVRVGRIPWQVKEYGTPALAVRADGARVRGFAWRGSMEGVNVGSHPFNPRAMREKHHPIRVVLERLWCDDIGEDALSVQPRAVVTVRDSHFRGNHGRLETDDADVRGLDKVVQIDSADVTFENCVFFDSVSAVRVKTRSRVVLRNCVFVNCSTAVSGDGLACPRPENPYDNGEPGRCLITMINCEAWDCGMLARAYDGCVIRLVDCRVHGGRLAKSDGGKVERYRAVSRGGRLLDPMDD